jgi:hypothetical protein
MLEPELPAKIRELMTCGTLPAGRPSVTSIAHSQMPNSRHSGSSVMARILPDSWLPKDTREDLVLILAFLAVLVPLLIVLGTWLLPRWRSRATARFEDGTRCLTVNRIGEHPLRLVVQLRKTDLLYSLNVACVERTLFRYRRAPKDAVSIRKLHDESGAAHTLNDGEGGNTLQYDPPTGKGQRPIGLAFTLVAARPWCGWISVRDDVTDHKARVRIHILARPEQGAHS